MNKLTLTLIAMSLLQGQAAFAAATEDARCTQSNDSLDATQAAARTAWAFKCYPDMRGFMPGKAVKLKDTQNGTEVVGYPTFARVDTEGNVKEFWAAPADPQASCEPAKTYSFIGFCRAGCYTPDQLVLFSDGMVPIAEAKKSLREDIITLAKDSSLEKLSFQTSRLASYTVDPIDKSQKILVIKTNDGGELKLTLNHPLLDSKGRMRAANTLEVGEELVKMDGQPDRIISIEEVDYVGKVYNVRPAASAPTENIVVAQGYLNGSVYYQNEGVKELNRAVLRGSNVIPDGLMQ